MLGKCTRFLKREFYGYYVMPILYGTRSVGRLDPKLDRRNKKMIINSLLETRDLDKSFISELAITLQRFLRFHNVSHVSIEKAKPKELKDALTRELNQLEK